MASPVISPSISRLGGQGAINPDIEGAESVLIPGSTIFTNATASIEVEQIGTGTPVLNSQNVFRSPATGAPVNSGG